MELGVGEGLVKVVDLIESIRVERLLDEVMEEVLDEGAVGVWGFDGKFREVAWAGEADRFFFFVKVVADGVDFLLVFVGAESSDGIVVFETEADGIDDDVAVHAALVFGEMSDFFAHREVWLEVAIFEFDGVGGRFEETTEDVSAEGDAAMDGRSLAMVGKGGEEVGVSEEPRAWSVGWNEGDEIGRVGGLGLVEGGESRVEVKAVVIEKLAVVGFFGPDDFVEEEVE